MKTPKSISILSALFIIMIPYLSLINATETRVGSMGGVGFFIRDNSNVFVFPGTVFQYGGQVISELRSKNNDQLYSIGVHLPVNDASVLGLHLNRPITLEIPAEVSNSYTVRLDRSTDIFYGKRSGDVDLGLKFTVGMDSDEEKEGSATQKQSARYFGIAGGLSSETTDIGLFVDIPMLSWEYEKQSRDWGGYGLGINARLFSNQSGRPLQFVPLGVLYYGTTSIEFDSGVTGAEKDKTDFGILNAAIGIGMNYKISESNMVILGIEVFGISKLSEDIKEGSERTMTTRTLPGLYLGVESNIKSWLIGRLGAAQVHQQYITTTKPQQGSEIEESFYSSEFKLTFGMALIFGSFTLDASINEGILFDGPNIISGSNEALSNQLSITYQF